MRWKNTRSIILVLALVITVNLSHFGLCFADTPRNSSQSALNKLSTVESIEAVESGDRIDLLIKLSSPATYTSYKTTSPLRLVIDFSQTDQGNIVAPLIINKGNFKKVSVNRYDTDAGVLTRVDVELDKDIDAVISPSKENPGVLRVTFPIVTGLPTKEKNTSVLSHVSQTTSNIDLSKNADTNQEHVVNKSENVQQGRVLAGLYVKDDNIFISVNGGVGEYKTINLSKPERYVLDLINVKNSLESKIIAINKYGISSARLGVYPDKVRIVFDTVNTTFPRIITSKTESGLMLAFKTNINDQEADTVSVAPLKGVDSRKKESDKENDKQKQLNLTSNNNDVATSDSASSSQNEQGVTPNSTSVSEIDMIDFQVLNRITRISIKVKGDISFEPPETSPGFLTLTVKKCLLPKRLQRSIETSGFNSPVLRIIPLQIQSRKGIETKIRVAMRKPVTYEYKSEGGLIYIDFNNDISSGGETGRALTESSSSHGLAQKQHLSKEDALKRDLVTKSDSELQLGTSATKQYKGRKVTLEFADAEVRKIFQLLSEVSNKNFVLGDDVTGSISIKLVNVPWDQALDIILDTKGLDKREDGNIIIIKGKGKFRTQAEEDIELKKQQLRSVELRSETFNINYSDISGIVSQLAALKSERGIIAPDSRTNKVIVKDVPQAIEDMRNLLEQLDVPEKQVMIEARIVEATSTFTRSLGINWGIHYSDPSGSFLGITRLDTGFGGLTTAAPTAGTGTTNGGNLGITFGNLGDALVNLRISAAATAGLVKIVSSPKIATLNNKTAKITQGQQIPYTASTSDKVETKFIEAALALEVTPHINANGTISMKIDAKNDSPGESTGGEAPPINKKQATTEMLLKDGETVVIGGIYVDNDIDSDGGVPFLMDIPFLGKLFKSNSKSKTKSELLIFITPRILET